MAARPSSRQLWTAKLNKSKAGSLKKGLKCHLPACPSKKNRSDNLANRKNSLAHQKKCLTFKAQDIFKAQDTTLCKPFKGCILGVDPSLRRTGLAVISYQGPAAISLMHREALPLKSTIPLSTCLAEIAKAVTKLLKAYPIDHVSLEQTIFVQNYQTAQTMGAVRGAIIATAGLAGLPVFEYPPLRIKQALTGFGRASKEQLAKTVAQILKIPFNFSLDEGDAAAAALCHAFTHK